MKSPITGHECHLGEACDLWWRTDSVTLTCGLIGYGVDDKGNKTQRVKIRTEDDKMKRLEYCRENVLQKVNQIIDAVNELIDERGGVIVTRIVEKKEEKKKGEIYISKESCERNIEAIKRIICCAPNPAYAILGGTETCLEIIVALERMKGSIEERE